MRHKMMKLIFIILVIGFLAYWYKCFLGINFSRRYSLSRYLPLKFMQRELPIMVKPGKPGTVLRYDFNWPFLNALEWYDPWSREQGLVEGGFARIAGERPVYHFLKSRSVKDYSIRPKKAVIVRAGDVFTYKARVRVLPEGEARLWLGTIARDQDRNVISWNQVKQQADMARYDTWQTVEKTFTVPDGTVSIQISISGQGKGLFWVDWVELEKK